LATEKSEVVTSRLLIERGKFAVEVTCKSLQQKSKTVGKPQPRD